MTVKVTDKAVEVAYKTVEKYTHLPVDARLRKGIVAAIPHFTVEIDDEGLKAASDVLNRAQYIPNVQVKEALTAAAPHLLRAEYKASLPDEVAEALNRFDEASQDWGWERDQGSGGKEEAAAKQEYEAARADLEKAILGMLK